MEATVMLADYAEAINGKFYVMGGGWNVCPPGPRTMSVLVWARVPWAETNVKHTLEILLMDDDGKLVELGEPPTTVVQAGEFEVGRPAGVPQGTELDFKIVFGFGGLPLEVGRGYRWQVEIDGEPAGECSFITREKHA
jgi:hypothetical protein